MFRFNRIQDDKDISFKNYQEHPRTLFFRRPITFAQICQK